MSNGWTLAVLLCSGWTGLNLLLIAFLYRLDGDDHDEDHDEDDDRESEMCSSQAAKHLVLFPLPPSRLQMSPGFNRFHPNWSNSSNLFSRQIYAESMADQGGRGWLENRGLPIFSRVGDLHNFYHLHYFLHYFFISSSWWRRWWHSSWFMMMLFTVIICCTDWIGVI